MRKSLRHRRHMQSCPVTWCTHMSIEDAINKHNRPLSSQRRALYSHRRARSAPSPSAGVPQAAAPHFLPPTCAPGPVHCAHAHRQAPLPRKQQNTNNYRLQLCQRLQLLEGCCSCCGCCGKVGLLLSTDVGCSRPAPFTFWFPPSPHSLRAWSSKKMEKCNGQNVVRGPLQFVHLEPFIFLSS